MNNPRGTFFFIIIKRNAFLCGIEMYGMIGIIFVALANKLFDFFLILLRS